MLFFKIIVFKLLITTCTKFYSYQNENTNLIKNSSNSQFVCHLSHPETYKCLDLFCMVCKFALIPSYSEPTSSLSFHHRLYNPQEPERQ